MVSLPLSHKIAMVPIWNGNVQEIINLIETGKANDALQKFTEFISSIRKIENYHPSVWIEELTQSIYDLGKAISIYPEKFLSILNEEIAKSTDVENEVLFFIQSEIYVNNFAFNEKFIEVVQETRKKYPLNAEFIHDLGHIEKNKQEYLLAISHYLTCVKLNPANSIFLKTCFNAERENVENLIGERRFEEASKYLNEVLSRKTYEGNFAYHNILVDIFFRIRDHDMIKRTLEDKQQSIESAVEKKLEKERFRVIEIIGIFTAIIAFIFSTISFTSKGFAVKDIFFLEITLGLILISFMLIISIIFDKINKIFYKDTRLYSFILLLSLLALIFFYYFNK